MAVTGLADGWDGGSDVEEEPKMMFIIPALCGEGQGPIYCDGVRGTRG